MTEARPGTSTEAREKEWRTVFSAVRLATGAPLVYAANWAARVPDITFDTKYDLTCGGRRIELISVPGGETIDSVANRNTCVSNSGLMPIASVRSASPVSTRWAVPALCTCFRDAAALR